MNLVLMTLFIINSIWLTSGTYLARQKCGLNGANLKFAIYNVSAIYKIKFFESTANDSRIIAYMPQTVVIAMRQMI